MIIQWTNVFSNETGYVKSVSTKERHFVNTFDKSSAHVYKSLQAAQNVVLKLISYGEGDMNRFEIVAIA